MYTAWWLIGQYQARKPLTVVQAAYLSLLLFCTSWLDIQGFIIGAILGLVLGFRAFFSRARTDTLLATGALVGLILSRVYFKVVGPAIMNLIWGVKPSFEKTQLGSLRSYIETKNLRNSGNLLLDHFGYLFGSLDLYTNKWLFPHAQISSAAVISLLVCFLIFFVTVYKKNQQAFFSRENLVNYFPCVAAVSFACGLYAMYIVMVKTFHPVLWDDVRLVYYCLPVHSLLLFFMGYVLFRLQNRWPDSTKSIVLVLLCLLGANLWSIPKQAQVAWGGYLKELKWLENGPVLRACMTKREIPPAVFKLSALNQSVCEYVREN